MHKISHILSIFTKSDLFKYLVTGGTAAFAEFLSFIIMQYTLSDFPIWLIQAASFTIGLIIAFMGHKLWTFRDKPDRTSRHSTRLQFIAYSSLAVINLVLTSILITVLVSIGIIPLIAKLLLMVSVVAWNFVILQKIIFRKN